MNLFPKTRARVYHSPFGRRIRREYHDPEVRGAARDLAEIYGTYKVLKHFPQLKERAALRYQRLRGVKVDDDPMDIMRQAYEGGLRKRPKRGLRIFAHVRGLLRTRFGLRPFRRAASSVSRRGKNVLRLLRVVK